MAEERVSVSIETIYNGKGFELLTADTEQAIKAVANLKATLKEIGKNTDFAKVLSFTDILDNLIELEKVLSNIEGGNLANVVQGAICENFADFGV